MKTDAIQRLINEAEEARGAAMELHALEESHATLLEALRGLLHADGHTAGCRNVRVTDGECSTECAAARDTLRKAGAL